MLRSVLVAIIALIPILPEIAHAAGIATIPAVVTVLGVTAAIQRVISLPSVNEWLTKHLNLGAEPKEKHSAKHSM